MLLNVRKHFRQRRGEAPPVRLDGASSAVWFEGWRRGADPPSGWERTKEVASATCWLLTIGWRKHARLIDPAEVPG